MDVKLINLCEYTVNQSLCDEGVYVNFRTAGERMDAQDFIEGLGDKKWIKN